MPPKTKRRPTTQQRALPPYPFHTTVTNRPLKKKKQKTSLSSFNLQLPHKCPMDVFTEKLPEKYLQ